jgi:lipopolysaccharide export system permease protein
MSRLVRPLDRYVFSEWVRIFCATALGLPILLIIIDLTDHLQKYLDRNIPRADIAMSYVYWIPQSMFLAMPAAVLFATVFAIGNFTRHAEITAAKASGISFYRLIVPVLLGAALASALDIVVAEMAPVTDSRRNVLLRETQVQTGSQRVNFAYAGDYGRVYKASVLDVARGSVDKLQIERKGSGRDYPTVLVAANAANYSASGWKISQGEMHVITDSTHDVSLGFDWMRDRRMKEKPADLMANPRDPKEMRFAELSRFITALERAGGDANLLRVERSLKLAIPITCLVIALIGAPLATTTQRGGAAWGIGISLGITVTFLMMVQLTRAIGGKGLIQPDMAAWVPNALFFLVGLVLMGRVRT